jgi:hypothetical protein
VYNSCVRKAYGTLLLVSLTLALLGAQLAFAQEPPAAEAVNVVVVEPAAVETADTAAPEPEAVNATLEASLDCVRDADCEYVEAGAAEAAGPGYEFFGPVGMVGQHPPAVLFLSPQPESALVLRDGAQRFDFKLDYANHMIRERGDGVIVDYDFETLRGGLEYRRGTPLGELSVLNSVTYRSHGILDNTIREFHDFFNMPNALRTELQSGMYRYVIATRDGLAYNGEGDVLGLGDTTLGLKHQVFMRRDGEEALAFRGQVKVPTGSSGDALGSGNWDFSLGLLYQFHIEPKTRAYFNTDYVWTGQPDWQNVGYQDIFSYMFGVEQVVGKHSTVTGQFHLSRNPLRTGNEEADKDAQELTFALNHRIKHNLVWTTGIHEDIGPETAPDFLVLNYLSWEIE